MLDQLQHLFEGVAWTTVAVSVVGGGAVVFLAYEHGWPWVKAKFQAITGKTSNAIAQIEDLVHFKVEDVHVRVDELWARVAKLEANPVLAMRGEAAGIPPASILQPVTGAAAGPSVTMPTETMKVVA